MKTKTTMLQRFLVKRWFRLTFSVSLAIGLAIILLLLPFTASTSHLTIPVWSPLNSALQDLPLETNWSGQDGIKLRLPFGATLVHATDGLTITKTAPSFVDQGGVITYTLVITNETDQHITEAIVTDFLPVNTACGPTHIEPPPDSYPRWGFSCSPPVAGWVMFYNPFVFPISFTIGTSNTLIFTADVDPLLPDGTPIVNDNYRIDANDDTLSDLGQAVTTTVRAPNWAIAKTVSSDTIEPGQYLTYTITITNDGSLPTSGTYTVTDPLPANTVSSTVQIQSPGFLNDNTVTWVFTESMPVDMPTTLTYSVQVASPLTDTVTIVNQDYRVTGGNVYSPAIGAPVTTTVEAPATLSIAKVASPDPVAAGDLITYTITITNNPTSTGPALDVLITDTLPAELFDQMAGFIDPAAGVVTDTVNPVQWQLDTPIPVGQSVQVTVTARLTSPLWPDEIANSFAASARNAPLVSDTLTTTVTATNVITLAKSVAPAVVAPGDTVTYTITLTNSGNSIASVDLSDVLHPDFTPATYNNSGIILPGRTPFTSEAITSVFFAATAPLTPGTYYNQIVTATYGLSQATISHIAPVHVVAADIRITKIANVSTAEIGQPVTYTYYLTNTGDITLTNVTLLDDPLGPIGLDPTELGPTESTTGTATVTVVETHLPGPIVNTATVTATYLANNLVTTSTTESVEIDFTKQITVEKSYETSAGVPANLGDTITYTYRITNTGTVTLTNIELNDDQLGSISVTPSTLGPDEGTVATDTTVVVDSHLPGPLVNLVTVTGTNIYVGEAVATNTASIPLTYTAAITVAKSYETSDGVPARIGDTITYTYRITNIGPVTLTNIELNDDKLGLIPVAPATLGRQAETEVTTTTVVGEDDLPGPLVNTATVTGTDIAGQRAVATDTASVPLTYTLGITINKTASQSLAAPGDRITYTYRITNTGELTLTSVTLSDDMVPFSNVEITTNLPPDTGFTYTATYLINQGDLPGPIINIATVTGTNSFVSDSVTATDTATVVLTYTPAITLEKTVSPASATIGDVVTYTYHITNIGNVDLNDVTLVDDRLGTLVSGGGPVFAGFSYPPVRIPYTITYSDLLNNYPILTNTATVTAANSVDPTIVSATDLATLTLVYNSDIQLTKIANVAFAAVGQTIVYTYTVTNTGNITLTNLSLADDRLGSLTPGTTTLAPNGASTIATALYLVQPGDLPAITNTAIVTGNDNIGPLITDTATLVVNVEEPLTAITATNSSPTPIGNTTLLTVTTNVSSGVTYTWNFGDGAPTQLGQFVNHIYPAIDVYTAVVTAANNVSVISATTVVTITAGPPARFELDAISPQTAGIPFTITITAVDALGNPTNFNGPVNISDLTGTIDPISVNLVNGTATAFFSVTTATAPNADRITAVDDATGTLSGFVDVVIEPDDPQTLTLTANPTTIRICQTANLTATMVDNWNNPTPGYGVNLIVSSTPPGAATAIPLAGSTNPAGNFTSVLTANAAGSVDITAVNLAPGLTSNDVTINLIGPPLPTAVNLAVDPATLAFDDTAVVTATVTDCNGQPAAGTVVTFTVGALATIGPPVTVTTNASGIATTTVTAGSTPGATTITGTVEGEVVGTATLTIAAPVSPIYLPIVLKNFSEAPDLISSFSVNPPNPSAGEPVVVTVVITNVGNGSTGNGFWVDFYIDPVPVPTVGNQRWDILGSTVTPRQGIAWAVPAPGLGAGQSVTLTSNGIGGLAPSAPHTIWGGSFYPGTQNLYVYADSFSTNGSPNGGIVESDETNNRSELHFLNPLGGGLAAESEPSPEPLQLPPRWDP